eukprot:Polyplicarium_translucidae@DN129_c0_g1_i1.p2
MKLYHFDIGGRAYPIRCGLHMAGVKFENVTVTMAGIDQLPMRSVPVLEVDGKQLSHTPAIMEYLGTATGLVPTESMMRAKHMELLCCLEDLFARILPSVVEKDSGVREELRVAFVEFMKARWLPCMDALIASSESKKGFAVCDKLTFADLWLSNTVEIIKRGSFEQVPKDLCNPFASIMKVNATVEALGEKVAYDKSIKMQWR